MKYVTEKELKEWFKTMKEKYPRSAAHEYIKFVESIMFDEFYKDWNDNLTFKEMKGESNEYV